MLSPAEREILSELKRRLRARFGNRLTRLDLFGSRARGAGRDDSDLDVLVEVTDVTMTERGEMLDVAADLGVEHGLVLSLLVVRPDARIPDDILREAVPL